MPNLPQNGHPEQKPLWHGEDPKKVESQPSAPKEKEFGSHNDSDEARPGKQGDEWKSPSNR